VRIVIMEEGVDYAVKDRPIVKSPNDVAKQCGDIRYSETEVFTVIMLNARNGLIASEVVTMGTLDASLVHAREVFRPALMRNSGAIILCHNHPSGDLTPSAEDIRITKKLVEAGQVVDIKVLDHVIISSKGSLSLREEGLVSFR
jgi:DNA repair protein RadC